MKKKLILLLMLLIPSLASAFTVLFINDSGQNVKISSEAEAISSGMGPRFGGEIEDIHESTLQPGEITEFNHYTQPKKLKYQRQQAWRFFVPKWSTVKLEPLSKNDTIVVRVNPETTGGYKFFEITENSKKIKNIVKDIKKIKELTKVFNPKTLSDDPRAYKNPNKIKAAHQLLADFNKKYLKILRKKVQFTSTEKYLNEQEEKLAK